MVKLPAFRLLLLACFITVVLVVIRVVQLGPVHLPEPVRQESRADGCVVSEEAGGVHYKEGKKNYEEAWIDYINEDNTVQVSTVDTKLSLLFRVHPNRIKCFRRGSIAHVTISNCKEIQNGKCDFSLPHEAYVRTESVKVIRWRYANPAP